MVEFDPDARPLAAHRFLDSKLLICTSGIRESIDGENTCSFRFLFLLPRILWMLFENAVGLNFLSLLVNRWKLQFIFCDDDEQICVVFPFPVFPRHNHMGPCLPTENGIYFDLF
eukprot:GHVN01012566.1.p1 GENE.GHVN01012566.1~~GHVN01012566.1.p1  ORF type:complete len:114 (+),score=5.52 GHVN01012566.1:271-612(+)